MRLGCLTGVGSALAWFAFPIVPTILGAIYRQELPWSFGTGGGPDPRDWSWGYWLLMTGPLLGYGFLAGATLNLPDDPDRRGVRGWFSRRALWMAIAPWSGFLAWAVLYHGYDLLIRAFPALNGWTKILASPSWQDPWVGGVLLMAFVVVPLAYGWLFAAWAALGRARRLGRLRQSLARGLAVALGFVGSLFGTFWAATETWRGYFFDPRIAPALLAALALASLAGCASTETLGEVRRRELYQAMLTAWLLGLALAWRWWSRPRSKPPRS